MLQLLSLTRQAELGEGGSQNWQTAQCMSDPLLCWSNQCSPGIQHCLYIAFCCTSVPHQLAYVAADNPNIRVRRALDQLFPAPLPVLRQPWITSRLKLQQSPNSEALLPIGAGARDHHSILTAKKLHSLVQHSSVFGHELSFGIVLRETSCAETLFGTDAKGWHKWLYHMHQCIRKMVLVDGQG